MKQWTEEELINDGNRLRNAEITNVSLNFKDHGVLTLDLTLSGGGWGVVFGGYALGHGYLGSKNFKGSKTGLGHSVKIIGNFIKDEWFDYGSFFDDKKQEESN